jgi:hypothetical protein
MLGGVEWTPEARAYWKRQAAKNPILRGSCHCGGGLEYEEAIGGYVCVECEAEHFE